MFTREIQLLPARDRRAALKSLAAKKHEPPKRVTRLRRRARPVAVNAANPVPDKTDPQAGDRDD